MIAAPTALSLALLLGGSPVPGSPPPDAPPRSPASLDSTQDPAVRWAFSFAPLAGLWFHGMALVDPIGPGPIPLYDPGYPARAEAARAELGSGPLALAGKVEGLSGSFRADPAFEVLHFLPLYFPQAARTEVLESLATLSRTSSGTPRASSSRTRIGSAALSAVLPTPAQRRVLGDFVAALEAEWDGFYRGYQQAQAAEWERMESAVQELWDGRFAGPLSPLLAALDMEGGSAFLVPALGSEGRVFSGLPANQGDNVLAVAAPSTGESPRTAIFSMIRELCFSLSRHALETVPSRGAGDSASEEGIGFGAVRAGALVLESTLPAEAEAYQRFFLSRAGRPLPPGEPTAPAFEAAFRLEERQVEALREIIRRSLTNGGVS